MIISFYNFYSKLQSMFKEIHKSFESIYKDNKGLLFLSSLIILLHYLIEEVLNKILVNPILSYITSFWLNDIIFIAFLICIIIRLKNKFSYKYQVSNKTFVINLLVLLFYIYYRYFTVIWDFTGFSIFCRVGFITLPIHLFDISPLFFPKIRYSNPLLQQVAILAKSLEKQHQPFFHQILS